MSMNLSIYVGPYMEVERRFDWYPYDSLVTDGRGEAGIDKSKWILIPNGDVPGITRQTEWDRYSDTPVVAIFGLQADEEKTAFARFVGEILTYCNAHGIDVKLCWGIVPCWS